MMVTPLLEEPISERAFVWIMKIQFGFYATGFFFLLDSPVNSIR